MTELKKLKARVLADGVVTDQEVQAICRELYDDARIDKVVVEFLIAIRDEAQSVCSTFEQFFFDAVKLYVLTDGAVDAEEAVWLRRKLFADGNIGEREKRLLWDLKHEASRVSREFQKLYSEYM
jgi:hypothetical protein